MKEADFFQHVAKRLGRPSPLQVQPRRDAVGAPAFWQAYQLSGAELVAKFQTELEKLGGTVRVFESREELRTGLQDLLAELHPASVATWGGEFVDEYELPSVLDGYRVVTWGTGTDAPDSVVRTAEVEVGITGCDYAIADTGTVVLLSSPEQGRSVSLLPSVHVVIVRASRLRTRMGEVWSEIGESREDGKLASSINFISGPSRSSDIENDLSIGVHGPAAVFALIWEDR